MNISNDKGVILKIFLLALAVAAVPNILIWGIFGGISPKFSMCLSVLSIVGSAIFFIKRINRVAYDVNLNKNSIDYSINNERIEINKEQILRIEDSGINSAPHEIIVFLKNGKTVEFFPSNKYGSFYKGKLKKILREWLIE